MEPQHVKVEKILEAAVEWNPTPALGVPPEEVAEPFTIMLWGVTTDRVKEWLKGVDASAAGDVSEIKGFASSAGVVEGPARVLKSLKEVTKFKERIPVKARRISKPPRGIH